MARIAHLSDLHFGRNNPVLLEPLIRAVNASKPDLVGISGDLTQRARPGQFQQARAFMDRLNAPCLVTPGNHDTPLDHLPIRLFDPYRRWRKYVGAPLDDTVQLDGAMVACLNTVSPLDWQRGRVSRRALRRTCRALASGTSEDVRIVVSHHPFEQVAGSHKSPMRGARSGLQSLLGCGADVVLCGHLHIYGAGPTRLFNGRSLIQVMAGTSLSSRLRGELNNFNLLDVGDDLLEIHQYVPDERFVYRRRRLLRFRRKAGRWSEAGGRASVQ
jgi:3',5'-cyclic AMP phosphodiesterase CpdA